MKYGPPNRKKINFYGDEKRQIAARQVFPILIELATDSTRPTITYGELVERIGLQYMTDGLKNPKTSLNGRRAQWMGLPLGCIWQTLWEYQHESGIEIPYLTTIVINGKSHIPTIFKSYLNWSNTEIADAQREVYDFQQWRDVMDHLMQWQQ